MNKTGNKKMDPVITFILILIILVIALAVVTAMLLIRLKAANAENLQLTTAYSELQSNQQKEINDATEQAIKETEEKLKAQYEEELEAAKQAAEEAKEEAEEQKEEEPWLDLSEHDELEVKPEALYDAYKTQYVATNSGLNLRAGPGTDYTIITVIYRGLEVQAAAEKDDWTFIKAGDQFGWVKTTYLSDQKPSALPVVTTEPESGANENADSNSENETQTGETDQTQTGDSEVSDGPIF